jgi:hypothetical protein
MTPTQTGSTFSPSLPGGKQMLRKSALILGIVGMLTAMGSVFAQSTANDVPFPNGFRDWFLVNTMIVTKDSPIFGQIGGLHHIYVNTVAFPTLKASGPYPYPDGSIFADEVHDFSVKEGSYVEGSKKAATVMVKDSKNTRQRAVGDSRSGLAATPLSLASSATPHRNRKISPFPLTFLRT